MRHPQARSLKDATYSLEKLKERANLGYLEVDGRFILE
jgi:hypothetical protein